MQEMLTKIILVLIQTPMAVLLYIQGVMGFWAHEMTLDMIKQGFIFGTTIATFAVALLKWWRDRQADKKMARLSDEHIEAERQIAKLAAENETLRLKIEKGKQAGMELKEEVRSRMDALEQTSGEAVTAAQSVVADAAEQVTKAADAAATKVRKDAAKAAAKLKTPKQ